eukprot:CAMPEP_0116031810 /NCGR_PEP_ID=MMETSP0321-20121206/17779_1 /TAXON_ID=163516 /ORGANISM="Leptocylindrus danicus var. danicus, Strain B650" /LENGTH=735 /DNA_ID=CAMNT_0003507093 /DNA_START=223 /DNA_END=2430 /DNA_ORIENTATION=+
MTEIPYIVSEVSGEDPDYPASQLSIVNSDGWQSPKNCSYPQSFVLRIPSTVEIAQLQILCHECKIPTKIEVLVATSKNSADIDATKCKFDKQSTVQRLGYVSLDSNEKSGFRGREQKIVNLGSTEASLIKLVFHKCFVNKRNVDNQVGIVGLTLVGKFIPEKMIETKHHPPERNLPCEGEVVDSNEVTLSDQNSPNQIKFSTIDHEIELHLASLEREKKEKAAQEDYLGAMQIKNVLISAQSSFDLLREMNSLMLAAAENEDYEEALRLKQKRDDARTIALKSLNEVAKSSSMINHHLVSDDANLCPNLDNQKSDNQQHPPVRQHFAPADRPIPALQNKFTKGGTSSALYSHQGDSIVETDELAGERQQDVTSASTNPTLPLADSREDTTTYLDLESKVGYVTPSSFEEQKPKKANDDILVNNCNEMHTSIPQQCVPTKCERLKNDSEEEYDNDAFEEGNHPLQGVPGYEDLPDPQDVTIRGDNLDLSKKIESLIGTYRMKCFYSRNWALREAALTKTSLLLTEVKEAVGLDQAAPILCQMLGRALSDRIVQVFLTSLILLDDCLVEFEEANMNCRVVIPLFEKIIKILMGKLAENKPKVVDGAETTLISFALSSCVGPSYIGNYAVKKLSSQELKSGRAVCNRLRLLQKLVDEFGDEAVPGRRVFSFIKDVANGFGHKDSEVREAAKELTITLSQVCLPREEIMDLLREGGLSDRQIREYQVMFDNLPYVEALT